MKREGFGYCITVTASGIAQNKVDGYNCGFVHFFLFLWLKNCF